MSFISRLMMRVAHELGQNPEVRAKASEVVEDEVKPRAKQAWQDAQPKIENAKTDFLRWTVKVRDEYRKGRDGE
jgi:hypothetical protein